MKSQTVIIDTESLAGMIRQEVKAAISPLILAINNSEYQQLPLAVSGGLNALTFF